MCTSSASCFVRRLSGAVHISVKDSWVLVQKSAWQERSAGCFASYIFGHQGGVCCSAGKALWAGRLGRPDGRH